MSFRESIGRFATTVFITMLSCLLLAINGAVVVVLYEPMAQRGPALMTDPRIVQLAYYVLPVVMLVGQWWSIDVIGNLSRRKQTSE